MKNEKIFNDYFATISQETTTCEEIMREVEIYFGVENQSVRSKSRVREVILARYISIYLCRELTQSTLREIGRAVGGRDHSVVFHCHKRIMEEMEKNEKLARTLHEIKCRLGIMGENSS